jgi:hydrogenase maturation protease
MSALLVGLGSPDRGDDAVGPVVAGAVAAFGLTGVTVVEQEDPTDLVLEWDAHELVVVVDAVVSGGVPGTVLVTEVGAEPVSPQTWAALGAGGTHAFGLGEAVELARVLGRLPAQVRLVLVEAEHLTPGAPLSDAVADAVPRAVEAVLAALGPTASKAGAGHVPG